MKRVRLSSRLELWTPWASKGGKDRHPEVTQKLNDFRFPGQGQHGLFPLPVEKRPSHGLGGSARDGLSPLPVKEKAVSWTWCALAGGFPRRPRRPPEVPGELSMPKHAIIVNNCSTKVMVFGAGSKLYIREAPGRFQEASRLTFDRVLF